MQNAKIGKTIKGPLHGLKHAGTINLGDGSTISRQEFRRDPAGVMVRIIQQQRALYSKEIQHWIHARANAENPIYPIRTLLYDIFCDIDIDGFLTGIIQNHRILPVKNKAFKIKNEAGDPDPDKAKLFQKKWFRDFIQFALESRFWGYSLPYFDEMEFDGKTAFVKKVKLIPRKHVHQERHVVTVYDTDLEGMDYTTDPIVKYVIPVGDEKDLGILNKATPLVILKRHGWQNWDEFGERFGLPIITVKTASQDPRVQGEIESWLEDMSTGAYGIFPMDTEIDIKENKKTDAYQVFQEMINKVNEELAVLILGQTMTSMNGSSRSQGEVHERVKDQITGDDEIFIATLINEDLIPLLRDVHGYPFQEGDCFEWDQPEDLQARMKIFQGVSQMGFQVDPEQVTEVFGVRIIGLKAAAPPQPGDDPGKPGNDPVDPEEEENNEEDEPEPKEKPKKKAAKKTDEDEAEELKAGDLIKLHTEIHHLYRGSHVH